MSEKLDARRAGHQRYKDDVKRRGKPFYPHAMFEDTIMSLVVVMVIIALAVIWHYTDTNFSIDTNGTTHHVGVLGPPYVAPADPGTFNFVPRPDWYFYFLFYLLRIFKWPASVFLGTIGVPTIGLILLIAMPFMDLRRERRLSRRPVAIIAFILVVLSMGELTWKGATAKESSGGNPAPWIKDLRLAQKDVPGATLVASSGCLNCHTLDGQGSSNLGAPDLTSIGTTNSDPKFFSSYVANPRKYGNNVMPVFAPLGQQKLDAIGQFLADAKGTK